MSAQNEIDIFEKKLESLIKNAFIKTLKIVDEFEITADYDTLDRIEDVVKGLGLRVYSMSLRPNEFNIAFEFDGPYLNMECLKRPLHCHIKLEHSRCRALYIYDDKLKENWYLRITDHDFNIKSLSEETVLETLNEMNEVLLVTVLSN